MNARQGFVTLFLAGSLVALGTGVRPEPLEGQASQITAIEAERRLEYRAATDAYESALAARAVAESRFSRHTQEISVARGAGDEVRRDQALGEVQRLSIEILTLDQRVEETADALRKARSALLDVLDAHLDLLFEQVAFAQTAADSTDVIVIYRDVLNRQAEVEADERGEMVLVPVVMPEVTAAPRDGPLELRLKAELLDRKAEQADSMIVELGQEVTELERRAQRDRGLQVLMNGIDRFGDADVPVGAAGTNAESTDAVTAEELEERLQSLHLLIARYETYRDEARRRARQFLELAGDIA